MHFFHNVLFTPVAYAESIDQFISHVNEFIVNPLIIFLFALALAFFLWGVLDFIQGADDAEKRTKGKSHMIYGILGMVIMMGVWTILNIIINTFGITGIDPEKGTVDLKPYTPKNSAGLFE